MKCKRGFTISEARLRGQREKRASRTLGESGGPSEGAVAVAQRHPNPTVTEADDVRKAITRQVSHQAEVLVDLPSARTRVAPKALKGQLCCQKRLKQRTNWYPK